MTQPTASAESSDHRVRQAWRVAALGGAMAVMIAGWMLVNHYRVPSQDPLKSVAIAAAKESLRADPRNESLKQQIRADDLAVRTRYFHHLRSNVLGAWLLLAGAAVFTFSAKQALDLRKAPPHPPLASQQNPDETAASTRGRWAVIGTTALVAALLGILAATSGSRVPATPAALEKLLSAATPPAPVGPTPEEFLANWPQFRGPHGDGVAASTNAPLVWNGTNGNGILWKMEVPIKGLSSPVIWGDRVFLTGADEQTREALCFDADTGALLWRKAVPAGPQAKKPDVPEMTGYAASTGATDGRRFFAIFATGDLGAFDFEGNLVWSKALGVPENMYGHSTSLLVADGKLIVQFDQGEAEAGKSRLYAFDPATGRTLWEQRRAVASTWATPLLIEATGRKQLITESDPALIAYDLADGRELWRADGLASDLAPSPIFAGGLVVALSPSHHAFAIRPDGQGDVTKTHIAWRFEDNVPDITSPVSNGELVFMITTDGMLTCLDTKTGAKVWEQWLKIDFNASPTLVGNRLYLVNLKGTGVIVAAERAFRELGRNELGEDVFASPAVVRDRLFVRGINHLFCIGAKAAASSEGAHER